MELEFNTPQTMVECSCSGKYKPVAVYVTWIIALHIRGWGLELVTSIRSVCGYADSEENIQKVDDFKIDQSGLKANTIVLNCVEIDVKNQIIKVS